MTIAYPSNYPCPLRPAYSQSLNFQTAQTPMEAGYIIQRRWEPRIFRGIRLSYSMTVPEFHRWWDWVHRYAFSWHTVELQGVDTILRYISNVEYQYRDFANVDVSVSAEVQIASALDNWTGTTPTNYAPPINDDDGTVSGTVTPDIDLNSEFAPLQVTISSSPETRTVRVPVEINAFGALYVAGGSFQLFNLANSTFIASSDNGQLRWHQDPDVTNSLLRLQAGADYTIRVFGEVGSDVDLWGTSS